MGDRVIMHIDMNAFYASVAQHLDPGLRGKAVAVVGDPERRSGIILAKFRGEDGRGDLAGQADMPGPHSRTARLYRLQALLPRRRMAHSRIRDNLCRPGHHAQAPLGRIRDHRGPRTCRGILPEEALRQNRHHAARVREGRGREPRKGHGSLEGRCGLRREGNRQRTHRPARSRMRFRREGVCLAPLRIRCAEAARVPDALPDSVCGGAVRPRSFRLLKAEDAENPDLPHEGRCERSHGASALDKEHALRAVHVRATNLVPMDVPVQCELFGDAEETERFERLDLAIDALKGRFGNTCVKWAVELADEVMSGLDIKRDNTVHPVGFLR